MSLGRIEKRLTAAAVAAASFAAAWVGSPARAEAAPPVAPAVTSTGKGMVGGGLLGAEVVCITMGAIGVERGWPYFVFGAVGAAGGVVGGYFVDTKSSVAEPSLYMLAGGLALVIPTLIVSLNATHYKPPEGDRPNEPATGEPAREAPAAAPGPAPAAPPPGAPGATTRRDQRAPRKGPTLASAAPAIPHIPLSALDYYKGKIAVGLPALEVRPLYTQREMWQYGVSQGSEVRVPLFQAMF